MQETQFFLPCFYPNIEIHSWPLGNPFRRQTWRRCIQVTSSVHAAQGALVAPGTACHDLGAGNRGTDPYIKKVIYPGVNRVNIQYVENNHG